MDLKEARRQARYTQFAVAASKLAIEDSKIDLSKTNLLRAGCMIGKGLFPYVSHDEDSVLVK